MESDAADALLRGAASGARVNASRDGVRKQVYDARVALLEQRRVPSHNTGMASKYVAYSLAGWDYQRHRARLAIHD